EQCTNYRPLFQRRVDRQADCGGGEFSSQADWTYHVGVPDYRFLPIRQRSGAGRTRSSGAQRRPAALNPISSTYLWVISGTHPFYHMLFRVIIEFSERWLILNPNE